MGPRVGDRYLQAPGAAKLGAGGEPSLDRRRRLAGVSRLAGFCRGDLRLRLPARARPDGPAPRRRRHVAAHRHRLLCLADAGVQSQRRRDALLGRPAVGAVACGGAARHRLVGAGRRARRRRPLRQADDGAAAGHAGGLDPVGCARPPMLGDPRPVARPGDLRCAGGAAGVLACGPRFRPPQVCRGALGPDARRRWRRRSRLSAQRRVEPGGHAGDAGHRRSDRAAPPGRRG